MKTRVSWLVLLALVLATVGVLLTLAQQEGQTNATIDDLYRLLTTEDGRSRLDVLEEWLADIDEEVDLVHSVAERMLEEQYGLFDQQEWTLDDLKYQLNTIEAMLQDLLGCPCP
jgi:hypothetical protein